MQDRPLPYLLLILLALTLGPRAAAQAELPYSRAEITLAGTTNGQPQNVPATLLKPDGNGPFPAIVIMHDCSGRGPHSSGAPGRWSQVLAPEGYVVIMPDSFTPRGFPDGVCTVRAAASPDQLRTIFPVARAVDAFVARDYLRSLPYVDAAHIGIMGGSHGGSSTLAAMVDALNPLAPSDVAKSASFAAGIALYPGCGARYGNWGVEREFRDHGAITRYIGVYKPVAPLLILIGEKDDWTPADQCQALTEAAQKAGYPVSIKVYPGAFHSFDSAFPPRYIAERRNANKGDGRGATTGGDPAAWKDAIEQVKAFFGRQLKGEGAKD